MWVTWVLCEVIAGLMVGGVAFMFGVARGRERGYRDGVTDGMIMTLYKYGHVKEAEAMEAAAHVEREENPGWFARAVL